MAVLNYPVDDPLSRVDGETLKANLALNDYALLGKGRSLRALADHYRQQTAEKPPTIHVSTLEKWSVDNLWQPRIADYERLLLAKQFAIRHERQLEWEEKAWQVANELLDRADQMLRFPLVRTETKDGKTTVMPARWSVDTISRFVQTADKIARLTTHTETEHHTINFDWANNLPPGVSVEDMETMVDEMAAQLLTNLETMEDIDD